MNNILALLALSSKFGPILSILPSLIEARGAARFSAHGHRKIVVVVDDGDTNEAILAGVKAQLEAGIISRF